MHNPCYLKTHDYSFNLYHILEPRHVLETEQAIEETKEKQG